MLRLLLLAVILSIMGAAYSSEPTAIQKPSFKLDGRSAADLSADWWKWAMSSPDEINPVRDNSGIHCDTGQRGNVWFLAGGFGANLIRRSCTIPAGKYIFFPIINMSYWPREENNGYLGKSNDACVVPEQTFNKQIVLYRKLLEKIKSEHAGWVEIFDPTDIYCDTQTGFCSYIKNNRFMYALTDHIFDYASGLVGSKLNQFLALK